MRVHEIDIERDGSIDTPLRVNLPDGRQLVIWAGGHGISVRLPTRAGHEEIVIDLPVTEHLATHCNEETGEFRVTAFHRH